MAPNPPGFRKARQPKNPQGLLTTSGFVCNNYLQNINRMREGFKTTYGEKKTSIDESRNVMPYEILFGPKHDMQPDQQPRVASNLGAFLIDKPPEGFTPEQKYQMMVDSFFQDYVFRGISRNQVSFNGSADSTQNKQLTLVHGGSFTLFNNSNMHLPQGILLIAGLPDLLDKDVKAASVLKGVPIPLTPNGIKKNLNQFNFSNTTNSIHFLDSLEPIQRFNLRMLRAVIKLKSITAGTGLRSSKYDAFDNNKLDDIIAYYFAQHLAITPIPIYLKSLASIIDLDELDPPKSADNDHTTKVAKFNSAVFQEFMRKNPKSVKEYMEKTIGNSINQVSVCTERTIGKTEHAVGPQDNVYVTMIQNWSGNVRRAVG